MKKYTFYLVGLVVLALSSCNKNKLYYPADFYQGTMQTCIDKNNIYVDIHRTFPHINTNSIFYYDNFPAEHLIEYNFATNKMDTLFSPKSSNFSPTYYPSDFYIVNRDSILISTMYMYYWSNTYKWNIAKPEYKDLSLWKINNYIDDSVYHYCIGRFRGSLMNIIDGKYLVTPVVKNGLRSDTTDQRYARWGETYDELKDWNRNHYIRINMLEDSILDVKLFCSGDWVPSHRQDIYFNRGYMDNIYSTKKERFYFFTEYTMEIAVADKEGNFIKSVTPESQFFTGFSPFPKEDLYSQTKMSKYVESKLWLSELKYDEYRNVFLRVITSPSRVSEDGMQRVNGDFVVMVLDEDLNKKYEVYFERKNYTGSIHITEKGVYLLKTDTDESNRYYKADRFIFD